MYFIGATCFGLNTFVLRHENGVGVRKLQYNFSTPLFMPYLAWRLPVKVEKFCITNTYILSYVDY